MMDGKKTYILVALAAISALALYAQSVITNGFDVSEFIKFLNTEALTAAFATVRLAISKRQA